MQPSFRPEDEGIPRRFGAGVILIALVAGHIRVGAGRRCKGVPDFLRRHRVRPAQRDDGGVGSGDIRGGNAG